MVFGLPGQPGYRNMLASSMPPARIRFRNFDVVTERSALLRLAEASQGRIAPETYADALANLEERVARFRNAEFGVRHGLPVDAFDRG